MAIMLATWERPGEVAIRAAADARAEGATVIRCLERGLVVAEDDPELVAIGRGARPNCDGDIELDAGIMDGRDLNCGAVCALRGILPAITVARLVMEKTRHNMIAGEQARRFAIENGFAPQNLMTPKSIEDYEGYLADPARAEQYIHTVDEIPPDTITMVGVEDGRFSAASSTSGLGYKIPGRVGDSPIIGAGIYADDEVGAAGATGWGEELWKHCVSVRVIDAMRAGMSAQTACESVMREMVRRRPETGDRHCVVFALAKDGSHGAGVIGKKFDLWQYRDGDISMQSYQPLEL
ncbi:MAG: isoaspartyl peptidase/L-asparaginase [Armatimonadetes bacterium]|nr:isoaspartyl peptidase/L-asparaginase [Armatimonadota bacterium]